MEQMASTRIENLDTSNGLVLDCVHVVVEVA